MTRTFLLLTALGASPPLDIGMEDIRFDLFRETIAPAAPTA
jgi:hypothetical protein